MKKNEALNILLADDDKDDCLFFKDALEDLDLGTVFTAVHDGEQLMQHLETVTENLPHALFLDLNMPRKNGFECLSEIQNHSVFKNLPVIIFSTSYDQKEAKLLFDMGAHYYICKPSNFAELKNVVHKAITLVTQSHGERVAGSGVEVGTIQKPTEENFLINRLKTAF